MRTPDFLWSFMALASFMRLSLKKAAHADVGGAPCRKSGYVGRKRWGEAPTIAFAKCNSPDYSPRQKPISYIVVIASNEDLHHPN
jgi:hypothetical protein